MLRVGDAAPDFSVSDHHGNTVSLGDYGNQKILLWFYPKADTPG
jgi:peroxiredoxin Q/BCP